MHYDDGTGGNNAIHYLARNPKSTIETFKILINAGADGSELNNNK